jgi:hypothetical protein
MRLSSSFETIETGTGNRRPRGGCLHSHTARERRRSFRSGVCTRRGGAGALARQFDVRERELSPPRDAGYRRARAQSGNAHTARAMI